MPSIKIEAEPRQAGGKNESRRLRRQGRIPAVLYGAKKESLALTLDPKQMLAVLHSETGHNTILDLQVRDGEKSSVVVKDWQYEPVDGRLLHVDLKRIALDEKLRLKIPVFALGEAKGVKVQGGILEFVLREIEVECLPKDIPEHIPADVTELVIGKNLRVGDLVLPSGVRLLTDPDRVVAHVVVLKAEEEKPVEEALAAAAPAEPEVIKKGKAEKAEEEIVAAGEEKPEKKGEAKPEGKKGEGKPEGKKK